MAAGKFCQAIECRRWTGFNGVVVQVSLNVASQTAGGLIPPCAVLFQTLHHDPVEVGKFRNAEFAVWGFPGASRRAVGTSQLRNSRARLGRLLFADHAKHLIESGGSQSLAVERRSSGEQLIQKDAERVDIAAGID